MVSGVMRLKICFPYGSGSSSLPGGTIILFMAKLSSKNLIRHFCSPQSCTAISSNFRKHRRHVAKADDFDSFAFSIAFRTGIDDETTIRFQILARVMKPAFEFRCKAALDFDGPSLAPRHLQDEIDFGAARRAVKIRLGSLRRGA